MHRRVELAWDDRKEAGIGLSILASQRHDRMLYVVTVEEYDGHAHIISGRKAEPHERKEYEEGRER